MSNRIQSYHGQVMVDDGGKRTSAQSLSMKYWTYSSKMRRMQTLLAILVICASVFSSFFHNSTNAFVVVPLINRRTTQPIIVSKVDESSSAESRPSDDADGESDDETLLEQTAKTELVALCEQFGLPIKGAKGELLKRLRDYAVEQQEAERQRLLQRRKNVEEGTEDEREQYVIVDDAIDEDEEDEIFFYYESNAPIDAKNKTDVEAKKKIEKPKQTSANYQGIVTAPPPPPIEPDENGERVVTVYSTTDQNDLTGVAASQPGSAASFDPLTSATSDPIDAPWETNNPRKAESTSFEIDAAKEAVTEVVQNLLGLTGLPGFQPDADEDVQPLRRSKFDAPIGFIDFDPSMVPTEMLEAASRNIRTGRGEVLREVLREFELRAIGNDGTAIDKVERGGGHYRQVSKVRSFLEGYRRAEVRRLARDTVTLLLDKLVSEGIEGLDLTLTSMIRSTDDTGDEGGELNDSLLQYLGDAIRQQEKKVDQVVDSSKKMAELERAVAEEPNDQIESLWKVDSEEGQRIETFDPTDPENQQVLAAEYNKATEEAMLQKLLPSSAQEKLLLLLKILRERIQIEATFSHDEKSRNLRVLAYCLQLYTNELRRELIAKEFGSSLDRLDSFEELVNSSIEYGESTSHQLQPSKYGSLNVPLLKRILEITKETRKRQAFKASGARS
jgi:hypothetical protein